MVTALEQVLAREVGVSIFIDLLRQIEAAIFFNVRVQSREKYLRKILAVTKKIYSLAVFYHFTVIEKKSEQLNRDLQNPDQWLTLTSETRKEVGEVLLAIKKEVFKLMEQNAHLYENAN